MVGEFGEGWARTQLPNGMYEDWIDKRNRAVQARQNEAPLIDYADFTHYKAIIEGKNNWNRVFRSVFGRAAAKTRLVTKFADELTCGLTGTMPLPGARRRSRKRFRRRSTHLDAGQDNRSYANAPNQSPVATSCR